MIMDGIKTKNEGKGEDSLKSEKCRKRNFDIAFLTDQDQPKSQTFEKHSILAFETNNKSAFKKVLKEPSLATTSFCASTSINASTLTMTTNQNVCAKCNLSFRMTSDLVYHMRSQHRPETDLEKLRRGEKLKCPVCGESFRERHHLTRHMTSHSNKEKITPPMSKPL
nr:EOG090X0POW [Artemia franciscana]